MGYCTNCGKKIGDNAAFCPYCGKSVAVSQDTNQCFVCGAQLKAGQLFCTNCGTSCRQSERKQPEKTARTLTVARKAQLICAGVSYKVSVDGVDFGKIGVGKSFTTTVFSDTVRVEIRCTTVLMTGIRLSMLLKISENARVDFELEYGGPISATVSGAQILQQG